MTKVPEGKWLWMIRVGERGQVVIPKEARELFDIQPGATILLLGDKDRGLAIPTHEETLKIMSRVFPTTDIEED